MSHIIRKMLFGSTLAVSFATAASVGHAEDAMVVAPDAMAWSAVPPMLPKGAEMAVISGNPMAEGDYVLRLRLPADYLFPPHTHSKMENVTVISGALSFGHGETVDKAAGGTLPAGGYVSIPAEMPHFAWVDEDTEIQIHGAGPFDITYINPDDDPQKATN